jgi:hypothetical protein
MNALIGQAKSIKSTCPESDYQESASFLLGLYGNLRGTVPSRTAIFDSRTAAMQPLESLELTH